MFASDQIVHLISAYGYWGIAGIVTLESMGAPLPAETAVIAAALYAARTHHLDVSLLFAAAAVGAILGDGLGYAIGRLVGLRLLPRYGRFVRLTDSRIKLGRYLFMRYGGRIVLFGRFLTILRTFASLLAGANRMAWSRFMAANVAGGSTWAAIYSLGPFAVGEQARHLFGWGGVVALVVTALAVIATSFAIRRNVARLHAEAQREFPGPL